jgi:hypothetical protein
VIYCVYILYHLDSGYLSIFFVLFKEHETFASDACHGTSGSMRRKKAHVMACLEEEALFLLSASLFHACCFDVQVSHRLFKPAIVCKCHPLRYVI